MSNDLCSLLMCLFKALKGCNFHDTYFTYQTVMPENKVVYLSCTIANHVTTSSVLLYNLFWQKPYGHTEVSIFLKGYSV